MDNHPIIGFSPFLQPPIKTEQFSPTLLLSPEDRSMAVSTQIRDQIPQEFFEIWYRFCDMGWAYSNGDQCIMQSALLRRILRVHGFPATLRQVIAQYEHPQKGWQLTIGMSDPRGQTPGIDTHMVVESNGLILDFADRHIAIKFGAMSPIAITAQCKSGQWQDLDFFGRVKYTFRENHPETRNQLYLCRNEVLDYSNQYFSKYRI